MTTAEYMTWNDYFLLELGSAILLCAVCLLIHWVKNSS